MRPERFGWLPWVLFGLTLAAVGPAFWLLYLAEGISALPGQLVYAGIFIGYGLVGALVATRRPENAIGWVLLGVSVLTGIGFFGEQYGRYALVLHPGSLPAAELIGWLGNWLWFPGIGLLLFGLLLFPTGAIPSPRWRPVAWLTGFGILSISAVFAFAPSASEDLVPNPFAVLPAGSVEVVETIFGVTTVVAAVLCLGAPILRFRRATGVERQQLKWFLYGGALLVAAFLLEPVATALPALRPVADVAFPLSLAAMPIAIALAILRHGLYEIDRIISRTIGYALVSLALLGVYAGGVVVLTQLTVSLVGGEAFAVAASTLAAAAMFRPLRTRIQNAVDRRFYRSRYDAQRTLEAFSLRAREEVDLDRLSAELRAAASGSLQPRSAWVWIKRS